MLTEEERVKKAHIAMMKHPETALYSGVMMMGNTEVIDDAITAYTDGINKRYGRAFLKAVCKTDQEVAGLVLHENLHIVLRHMLHNIDLFREDRKRANMAADYVVNDIIVNIKDKNLVKLPEGGCYDPKYHNMNMREVYKLLEGQCGGGGSGDSGEGEQQGNGGEYSFDEHDTEGDGQPITPEKAKEVEARIDRALREGAMLAGRLGIDLPRAITDILNPKVDWREVLREFVSSATKGKDEYTWRKFNRRVLPNDLYIPTVENETIGEIVVAIDTSGSIGEKELNEFASERSLSVRLCRPKLCAFCGGTPRFMVSNCSRTTTQTLHPCSSPWVAEELRFHVCLNTSTRSVSMLNVYWCSPMDS
jgi:predicted metal-dependent peptidase